MAIASCADGVGGLDPLVCNGVCLEEMSGPQESSGIDEKA